MSGVTTETHVPTFDGRAPSFTNYEEKATLWNQISPLDPQKRASNFLLRVADVARKVCASAGKDVLGNVDGAALIVRTPRGRLAPDAIDSTFQEIAKLMLFKRTGQAMGTYLMEFDTLRRKAEARVLMESGFPEEFVSAFCAQNATLSKNEKTLVLASLRNTLAFPEVSAQMRRLSGPRGFASRQDVPAAADMDAATEEGDPKRGRHIAKPRKVWQNKRARGEKRTRRMRLKGKK